MRKKAHAAGIDTGDKGAASQRDRQRSGKPSNKGKRSPKSGRNEETWSKRAAAAGIDVYVRDTW